MPGWSSPTNVRLDASGDEIAKQHNMIKAESVLELQPTIILSCHMRSSLKPNLQTISGRWRSHDSVAGACEFSTLIRELE